MEAIYVIYAGIMYLVGGGSAGAANNTLSNAVIGLALILCADMMLSYLSGMF